MAGCWGYWESARAWAWATRARPCFSSTWYWPRSPAASAASAWVNLAAAWLRRSRTDPDAAGTVVVVGPGVVVDEPGVVVVVVVDPFPLAPVPGLAMLQVVWGRR